MTAVRARALALRRILAIGRKELRQLSRDRSTLALVIGIPAIQLILFGYAINLDVRHVPSALLDQSKTSLSRKLVGELEATQTFVFTRVVHTRQEAIALVQNSVVGAVVMIPPDLDRRLLRGRGAELSILVDATNPVVAAAVTASGEGLGKLLSARFRPIASETGPGALRLPPDDRDSFGPRSDFVREGPLRIAVLPFYNPERRTAVFIVPGLIGVILTLTMMLMTALAIVRERERGTFEFLIATPVRSSEVMIGKILPYIVVGVVQVSLILALGWLLFDVPFQGSYAHLALGSLVFIGAMLAMGLLISSAATTQFQAMQMAFFFFLPSMLLSGFMFPFESMPRLAQWLGNLLPLTHFLRIVRGVLLKGAAIWDLQLEIAWIAGFLLVALALAASTFRKRIG